MTLLPKEVYEFPHYGFLQTDFLSTLIVNLSKPFKGNCTLLVFNYGNTGRIDKVLNDFTCNDRTKDDIESWLLDRFQDGDNIPSVFIPNIYSIEVIDLKLAKEITESVNDIEIGALGNSVLCINFTITTSMKWAEPVEPAKSHIQDNIKMAKLLLEYLEKYPEIRFAQALYNLNILDYEDDKLNFYTADLTILNRVTEEFNSQLKDKQNESI